MTTATRPADAGATVPLTLPPGGGEGIWIVGDTMQIKATARDTRGAFTMLENTTAPGGGPPPHLHRDEDEAFYVLDGRFELLIGDETFVAEPGAFAFVPRGTVHRFRNVTDRPARILITFTPGGLEGFFRASGVPAGEGPPPPVGEAEIARTREAGERYGLSVVAWEG